MKCPKCNYTSFDYLDSCKRCGSDLRDVRTLLQIIAVSPEDQAPTAPSEPLQAEVPEYMGAEAAEEMTFGDRAPLGEEEEVLEGLDFEGTFDELVEHTSYADQGLTDEEEGAAEPEHGSSAGQAGEQEEAEEEEELLDLDFGDLFEEKDK